MAAASIPWPLSSNPGSAPNEGAGRVLNCYAYKDAGGPRWRPLPGLTSFTPIMDGTPRGALTVGNIIYAVIGNTAVQITADGSVTPLDGSVAGTGPVTMARNNGLNPDIVITTEYGSYVLQNRLVALQYPGTILPAACNSVTVLDGFFLWTAPDGTIWASDLNSTNVQALSNAKAEAKPDSLLRGVAYGEQFFAMGTDSIEVWQDVGTSPFPLQRVAVVPIGLLSQFAVAGDQTGWGGPLIFVAADNSVRRLDGYTPTRISNEDLERLIEQTKDGSLTASVYTFKGNSMWSLSSSAFTWEYNVTTDLWSERESQGQARWLAGPAIKAFGNWYAPDASGGTLYQIDDGSLTEGSGALVWGLDSGRVAQFPARVKVPVVVFDFVRGQAALGRDPHVMISWSHDGGAMWSNPILRGFGRTGEGTGRIAVNRIGLSTTTGPAMRFRISDQAYTSFAGASMEARPQ